MSIRIKAGPYDYDDFYDDHSPFRDEPRGRDTTYDVFQVEGDCSKCGTHYGPSTISYAGTEVYCRSCGKRLTGSELHTVGSRKTATWYCNTHDVFVGDGNRDTHADCKLEQRQSAETKESAVKGPKYGPEHTAEMTRKLANSEDDYDDLSDWPTAEKSIDAIRQIVTDFSAKMVDGVFVDAQSAKAIVTVYDALNDANKAKFAALPIDRMGEVAWKLVNKSASVKTAGDKSFTGLAPNSWYVTDRAGSISAGPHTSHENARRLFALGPEFARVFETDAEGNGTVSNVNPKAQVYYSSRKTAADEKCGATSTAHIGNQTPMKVTCTMPKGHEGQHKDITLDSDDNAIVYRWPDSENTKTGAGTMPGFYRTIGPDNGQLEWVPEARKSDFQSEKERLFPDGIPLRGELTPEQEAWLKKRSSRKVTAARTVVNTRPGYRVVGPEDGYYYLEKQVGDTDEWYEVGAVWDPENIDYAIDNAEEELRVLMADAREEFGITGARTASRIKIRMTAADTALECYSCGLTGSYDTFGIPTRCPQCGSYEVHLPEAQANWAKKGSQHTASWTKERSVHHPTTGYAMYDLWASDDPAIYAQVWNGPMVENPRVSVFHDEGGIGMKVIDLPLPHRNVSDNEVSMVLEQEAKPSYVKTEGSLRTAAGPPPGVNYGDDEAKASDEDKKKPHEYVGSSERCRLCGNTRNHVVHQGGTDKEASMAKTSAKGVDWGSTGGGEWSGITDGTYSYRVYEAPDGTWSVDVYEFEDISSPENPSSTWRGYASDTSAMEDVEATGYHLKTSGLNTSDLWSIAAEWTGNDYFAEEDGTDYDGQEEMPMSLADEISENYIDEDEITKKGPSGAAKVSAAMKDYRDTRMAELNDALDLPAVRPPFARGEARQAVRKTAGLNWQYQEGYGWHVTPADFDRRHFAVVREHAEGGGYLAMIYNMDGGEYDADTLAASDSFADLQGAKYWVERFVANPWTASKTAMPAPADLGVKVGDIFYNSWGYDQTNVNFYEVIRLTGQGVEVQPIASRVVNDGAHSQSVVAAPGVVRDWDVILGVGINDNTHKSKVCRLKSGYQDRPSIVLKSGEHWAYLWDGTPKHQSGPYGGH